MLGYVLVHILKPSFKVVVTSHWYACCCSVFPYLALQWVTLKFNSRHYALHTGAFHTFPHVNMNVLPKKFYQLSISPYKKKR